MKAFTGTHNRGEAQASPPAGWRDANLVLASFGFALAYATLRYNVFKDIPWAEWPIYTVNKALGLTALILLVFSVRALTMRRSATGLLSWAGAAILLHVVASLAILDPHYFPKFYVDSKLSFIAGLSMMIGGVAAVGMEAGSRKSSSLGARQRVIALATIAAGSGIHAALTGMSNWLAPWEWPGGLPPITLLSFLIGGLAVVLSGRFVSATGTATMFGVSEGHQIKEQ